MRITCQGLTYTYDKNADFKKKALNNINLTVEEGDFLGIIGHTGSGKSTFVQHLNGLIPVQEGLLKIGDYDLSADKRTRKKFYKELRSKVGMVFQYPEYQLFADTVFEDVAFGIKNFYPQTDEKTTAELVKTALTTVGLDYYEVKDKSPFELSGGQKRRVAIAGVIVTKPEILVLDEPVAGLDPKGKKELMSLLHDLQRDFVKTIIMVSHDMNEVAENCNKAVVFSEGEIVLCGTPYEIFSDVDRLISLRLDVPDVAYVVSELKKSGININVNNFSVDEFITGIVSQR